VHIEQVTADGKTYEAENGLASAAEVRNVGD
jgi:hypothetical protein